MLPGADPCSLERIGQSVLSASLRRFAQVKRNDLALALICSLDSVAPPAIFVHRGKVPLYPASLVKIFYLVALESWLERGRLKPSRDLDRASEAMIARSSNDATNHIVDLLTGTTGGPDLVPAALARWLWKRAAIDRYFKSWNWPAFGKIRVTQKTWDEAPYGRERQSRFEVAGNRNRLTAEAVACLLWAIDNDRILTPARCRRIRRRLYRPLDRPADWADEARQLSSFFAEGLPKGAKLWSKAGWTSTTRHDAAIVQLPEGPRFVLVAMSQGPAASANRKLLPTLAREACRQLKHCTA